MADEKATGRKLTEDQASRYLNRLLSEGSRVRQRIDVRRQHLSMDPAVAPKLLAPLNKNPEEMYQSDLPRQKHVELKGRLLAHHGHVHCKPPSDSEKFKKNVESLENVLNSWWHLAEERVGYTLQDALSDGQIVDCYAILHVRHRTESWPELPPAEYVEELPEDEKEKERYSGYPEEEGEEKGKYRETETSREARHKRMKAEAGCPYYIECIDPAQFAFFPDRRSSMAAFVHYRDVMLLDYEDELRDADDKTRVSLTVDKRVQIEQHDVDPAVPLPGRDQKITVACFWTRDEWYEMACQSDTLDPKSGDVQVKWTFVKGDSHEWGCPPAVLVLAHRFHTTDIAAAYTPALEGLFRLKPQYDRDTALMKGLAERTALPEVYIVRDVNGDPVVDDDGYMVQMTRDSAKAEELPAGWKLEKLNIEINPAFVEAVAATRQEFEAAAPPTGMADTGASTQPWTLRLDIDQRSVIARQFIQQQAVGLREFWRLIVKDMVRQGREFTAFKVTSEGVVDPQTVIGVKSEDIEGLTIEVKIDNVSSAERITITQHGAELLKDGLITEPWFYEDYMGIEDPQAKMREVESYTQAKPFIQQVIQQRMKARYGSLVYLGQNGELIGPNGVVTAEQAFAMKGLPAPFPGPRPTGGVGGMGTTMGDLAGPQVDGAVEMAPLVG